MSYFDENNLRRLADGLAGVAPKTNRVVEAFLGRRYASDLAKEYAHHGVIRRLTTLARCIEQIFTLLPPELDEVPHQLVRTDATIFVQAFVFNAYGALDNLAFVWVNERDIRKADGQPLPNGRIGLTKDKVQVCESFSAEMQAYWKIETRGSPTWKTSATPSDTASPSTYLLIPSRQRTWPSMRISGYA